jgi:hypothetical protein
MHEVGNATWEAHASRALEEYVARSRTIARRSRLDAAALEALDGLHTAGIDALLLKGPALARALYRPDEHRGYFDVDLLVAPADLGAAGAVLARLGYTNVSEKRGIDDLAGILHAQLWSRLDPGFGNVSIDLHWRLAGCDVPPQTAWTALSANRAAVNLGGRSVATLGSPGLAFHLALHAAQHGPDDLQAVGDLDRGLSRLPPEVWKEAAQLAPELRATEAFAAGLRLLPAGVALADDLRLPWAEALLWQIAHRDARPRGTFHLQALTDAKSLRERALVVRRSLLPTRAWIVWEQSWAAPGGLRLVAAYALHIARAPVWVARAWRFRRQAGRHQATRTKRCPCKC